jgi:hypothetical protein
MSRIDALKILKNLNQLEKDVLSFYRWLLLDKKQNNDLAYLGYSSIVVIAIKILNKHKISHELIEKQAGKLNLVSHYFYLDSVFDVATFRDKFFTIDEIKIRRNKWYVPDIDQII